MMYIIHHLYPPGRIDASKHGHPQCYIPISILPLSLYSPGRSVLVLYIYLYTLSILPRILSQYPILSQYLYPSTLYSPGFSPSTLYSPGFSPSTLHSPQDSLPVLYTLCISILVLSLELYTLPVSLS
jgi:hypothetical protein